MNITNNLLSKWDWQVDSNGNLVSTGENVDINVSTIDGVVKSVPLDLLQN